MQRLQGPVADNTSPRSITLWKYEVKDLSELGDRGDGEMDDTVTKTPLAGIKVPHTTGNSNR